MSVQDHAEGYSQAQQDQYLKHLRKLKTEFQDRWKSKSVSVSPKDFERITVIGTGAFGIVYLVKQTSTGNFFAMKTLEKAKIIKMKQLEHSRYEKNILCAIDFPFLVRMEYFCKDNVYIYFLMPFIVGGEMFTHLRRAGKFDENLSKFYAGQVILALEYLHNCDLVYRDLKPENIMIANNGYLKLTDFGFCKIIRGRTWTLCGTPEYLAPEVVLSKGYGTSVDWWSLGVLIFEMAAGHPPFYASDPMRIYERIVTGKYRTPGHFSGELNNLVKNTLQVDTSHRFGVLKNGTMDFKTHRWFRDLDWDALVECSLPAPFLPKVKTAGDTSNFDRYDEEQLRDNTYCLFQSEFADF